MMRIEGRTDRYHCFITMGRHIEQFIEVVRIAVRNAAPDNGAGVKKCSTVDIVHFEDVAQQGCGILISWITAWGCATDSTPPRPRHARKPVQQM